MPQDSLNNMTGLDESRLYAAMSYLYVLVIVPWLLRRRDPFVNWHVRQGLIVLAVSVAALILAAWWPTAGSLLFFAVLIADVVALVMAMQGRRWRIPLLSMLAGKFRV